MRIATASRAARGCSQARIDLAREIHERVVQRLFGVSLVLGSEHGLSEEARQRCADEMQAALADLREALARPLAPPTPRHGRDPARRARAARRATTRTCRSSSTGSAGVEVPEDVEPLAQSVLAEALRNADKHAGPTRVRVHVGRIDGTFVLEVRNDGVAPAARARHRHGPAAGRGRGAPARRRSWSSAPERRRTGGCGWSCRSSEDDDE